MGGRPEDASDTALVLRVAQGDQDGLAEIYRRYGQSVYSAARKLLRNDSLAEDVTQEVFVRLWQQPGRFDPDRGGLKGFLLIDAHGRSVDLLRADEARRKREDRDARLAPSETAYSLEQEVMARVSSEHVRAALDQLKPEERQPIALAYFGGRTYREVAEVLEIPEGTVKSRIRVGLRHLNSILGPIEVEAL